MPITRTQVHKLGKHTVTANFDTGILIRQEICILNGCFVPYADMLTFVVSKIDFPGVVQTVFPDINRLFTAIYAYLAVIDH
jgi:hypothetical protein